MAGKVDSWKILLVVLSLSLPSIATADIISIPASADGDVIYQGVLGYTVDSDGTIVSTSRSGGSSIKDGIYEFSLAALPADAIIQSATLKLTTATLIFNTGSTADVGFYGYTGDGVVTDADHQLNSVASLMVSETFAAGNGGVPSGTTLEIELANTTPLQDAVGSSFFGIRSQTANFVTLNVHSLETDDSTAMVPTLEVMFVPEPAGLLAGALGALALLRRR